MNSSAAAARMAMMRQSNQIMAVKNSKASSATVINFEQQLKKYSSPSAGTADDKSGSSQQNNSVNALIRSENGRFASTSQLKANGADSSDTTAGNLDDNYNDSSPIASKYSSFDSFIGAFAGISDNPIKSSDWLKDKPDHLTDAEFEKRINDMNYRYSLLDKDVLPYGLTRPEEGISRSTDVESTKFIECTGGIERRDYFAAGDNYNRTYIPVMEWRHITNGGAVDSQVGDAYSMQTPFGFKVTFMRGSSGTPSGYTSDGYQRKLDSLLAEG